MKKKRCRKRKLNPVIKQFFLLLLVCVALFAFFKSFQQMPPAIRKEKVLLVNADHALADDYTVDLVTLRNDERVAEEMYPSLQKMFDDMRAYGMKPSVRSGYRSPEQQVEILNTKIQEFINLGYSTEQAEAQALETVSKPHHSEHETGLSVDIGSESRDIHEDYTIYAWLITHCVEYGFILRYPEGKEHITGISYEPWHYRYVGEEIAQTIKEQNLCLEEYVQ